jgi:hypothetical protein
VTTADVKRALYIFLIEMYITPPDWLRHSLHPESNSRKITELRGLTTAHVVRRFSNSIKLKNTPKNTDNVESLSLL